MYNENKNVGHSQLLLNTFLVFSKNNNLSTKRFLSISSLFGQVKSGQADLFC
jgi:hypothetical protein